MSRTATSRSGSSRCTGRRSPDPASGDRARAAGVPGAPVGCERDSLSVGRAARGQAGPHGPHLRRSTIAQALEPRRGGPRTRRPRTRARTAGRRHARRRDEPLSVRCRRQARAPHARAADRRARRRRDRRGDRGRHRTGAHPPRLALPRRRDGCRGPAPRSAQRPCGLGQQHRDPHGRPALLPREPDHGAPRRPRDPAAGRHLRAARARADARDRRTAARARTPSRSTCRCSRTRPGRSSRRPRRRA